MSYKYNENFFKESSANLAYFLGFFLTDGYKNNYVINFQLQSKDKNILDKFANVICMDKPVSVRLRKDGREYCDFSINSKAVCYTLENIVHCGNHKTFNLKVSNETAKIIKGHEKSFLRGVIDGDGYIGIRYSKIEIVSASISFLEYLKEMTYNALDFDSNVNIHAKTNNCYSLQWCGYKAHLISEWCYNSLLSDDFVIDRKLESAQKLLDTTNQQKIQKLKDPTGKIYSFYERKLFCDKHNLVPQNIYAVISGKRRSSKNWSLPDSEVIAYRS